MFAPSLALIVLLAEKQAKMPQNNFGGYQRIPQKKEAAGKIPL